MSVNISEQSIAARLVIDKVARNIAKQPMSDAEKRDTFLYGAIIMAAVWKIYAPKNMGDLLIGFPFVGEDQESAVADVPQALLDEMKKWLNSSDK